MIRKFKFEDEMHESLQCVPMAVRRKLDRVGLKIGLEQWKSLDLGERLAICHFPVDSDEELDGLGVFIREAMKRRFGADPKSLTDAQRALAEPPASPFLEFIATKDRYTTIDAGDLDPRGCILQPDNCARLGGSSDSQIQI